MSINITVPAEDIVQMHDGLLDIIDTLDSIGNGTGTADAVSDAISDLRILLTKDMFNQAEELAYTMVNDWDDDEDAAGVHNGVEEYVHVIK